MLEKFRARTKIKKTTKPIYIQICAPIERRMEMLIGIDVGGTTTDAVLVDGGRVTKTAYVPTDHDNLLKCLLGALDELVKGVDTSKIERVVLSTTLITNMIAEGKTDPVALVLIPGPGTNPKDYSLGEAIILDGAIDFRGKEIDRLNESQIKDAAAKISGQGLSRVAVVGKFCQRNHAHELKVGEIMATSLPEAEIELGHRVSGQLNFPRRAATTMLTVATKDKYREFAEAMAKALKQRKISAPVYILKADGGTLPLDKSVQMPVETIFSGPAASIMGVMALTPPGQTSVVVDIGGTTTDLALILSGKPLLSSKGAKVGDPSHSGEGLRSQVCGHRRRQHRERRRRLPGSRAAQKWSSALHGWHWTHAYRCFARSGTIEHRRRRQSRKSYARCGRQTGLLSPGSGTEGGRCRCGKDRI